jgi:hypothetical protein
MIIYYDRNTGRIYGAILGRIHNEFELKPNLIQPKGVNPKDIERKVIDRAKSMELERYLEGHQIGVLDCEVILDDPEELIIRKKPVQERSNPDSIETIEIYLTNDIESIYSEFSSTTKRYLKDISDMKFMEIPFSRISMIRDVIGELEDMKDIVIAKQILSVRATFLDGLRKAYAVVDGEENPLAVAVITSVGNRFKYTLGGVTGKGRSTHAGDFLFYSLIKEAKELGFKIFDVGGVYADWAGEEKKKVNIFKSRWGGKLAKIV